MRPSKEGSSARFVSGVRGQNNRWVPASVEKGTSRPHAAATNAELAAVLGVSRAESVPNLTRRFAAWLETDPRIRPQLRGLEKESDKSRPSESNCNRSDTLYRPQPPEELAVESPPDSGNETQPRLRPAAEANTRLHTYNSKRHACPRRHGYHSTTAGTLDTPAGRFAGLDPPQRTGAPLGITSHPSRRRSTLRPKSSARRRPNQHAQSERVYCSASAEVRRYLKAHSMTHFDFVNLVSIEYAENGKSIRLKIVDSSYPHRSRSVLLEVRFVKLCQSHDGGFPFVICEFTWRPIRREENEDVLKALRYPFFDGAGTSHLLEKTLMIAHLEGAVTGDIAGMIPSKNSAPISNICRALAEGVLIRVFPSKRIIKAVWFSVSFPITR